MNKKVKNILYLFILLLVVALIGYVIFSYTQFNGIALPIDDLKGKIYFSYDGTGMFEIDENGDITFLYSDTNLKSEKAEYTENIFKIQHGEQKLYFYVLDGGRTIYNDMFRLYLHEEVTEE